MWTYYFFYTSLTSDMWVQIGKLRSLWLLSIKKNNLFGKISNSIKKNKLRGKIPKILRKYVNFLFFLHTCLTNNMCHYQNELIDKKKQVYFHNGFTQSPFIKHTLKFFRAWDYKEK